VRRTRRLRSEMLSVEDMNMRYDDMRIEDIWIYILLAGEQGARRSSKPP
jgi:hypothetical protein